MSGALVAFEGLDQSGKATQSRRLGARLEAAGETVVLLTFPCYRTAIAQEIARALHGEREYTPDVLQLLFIANRYEYRSQILDWMSAGHIVLCDRYLASSVAYGEAHGLDAAWMLDVQRFLPEPAVTVLIDIAPETALARKAVGRDRFERDLVLLSRVRESYLRQAATPGWHLVDGEQPVDLVEARIADIIDARLRQPSAP